MLAASNGRTDIVRLLLEHGADVNHVDNVSAACVRVNELNAHFIVCSIHFFTCCMPACVSRTCTYILHAPRVVRQYGRTALMLPARWGRTDIVRLLLEHGADVNHANNVSAACVWDKCIKGNKKKATKIGG